LLVGDDPADSGAVVREESTKDAKAARPAVGSEKEPNVTAPVPIPAPPPAISAEIEHKVDENNVKRLRLKLKEAKHKEKTFKAKKAQKLILRTKLESAEKKGLIKKHELIVQLKKSTDKKARQQLAKQRVVGLDEERVVKKQSEERHAKRDVEFRDSQKEKAMKGAAEDKKEIESKAVEARQEYKLKVSQKTEEMAQKAIQMAEERRNKAARNDELKIKDGEERERKFKRSEYKQKAALRSKYDCVDNYKHCKWYAERKYCTKNIFIRKVSLKLLCRKSCNACTASQKLVAKQTQSKEKRFKSKHTAVKIDEGSCEAHGCLPVPASSCASVAKTLGWNGRMNTMDYKLFPTGCVSNGKFVWYNNYVSQRSASPNKMVACQCSGEAFQGLHKARVVRQRHEGCEDDASQCDFYKKLGYCQGYVFWRGQKISHMCRKTCGTCSRAHVEAMASPETAKIIRVRHEEIMRRTETEDEQRGCTNEADNCKDWGPKYCGPRFLYHGEPIAKVCAQSCGTCTAAQLRGQVVYQGTAEGSGYRPDVASDQDDPEDWVVDEPAESEH